MPRVLSDAALPDRSVLETEFRLFTETCDRIENMAFRLCLLGYCGAEIGLRFGRKDRDATVQYGNYNEKINFDSFVRDRRERFGRLSACRGPKAAYHTNNKSEPGASGRDWNSSHLALGRSKGTGSTIGETQYA